MTYKAHSEHYTIVFVFTSASRAGVATGIQLRVHHIEQQSLSNVLLFWNIILSGGDEQMVINNHSSVTCLVMESMSRTKRSCSVRTPGHEPNDIISLCVWGEPVSQNKRTHRYCRAAAACNESHCWSFLPSAPEHNRANWGCIFLGPPSGRP